MKNLFRRIAALVLTAALLAGSSLSALALDNYPDAYWDLAKEWESVVYSQDLEGILTTADKFYALFKDYPLDADLCKNLQPRYARASWTAEMLGDAKTALLWLEREMELVNWIYENLGDYRDLILNGNARMDYLRAAAEPAIYTLTDTPADYGAGSPLWAPGTVRMWGEVRLGNRLCCSMCSSWTGIPWTTGWATTTTPPLSFRRPPRRAA